MFCRSVEFILHTNLHMLGLIGRAIVGRPNGYQYCRSSTRLSTSFYNGIDKLLSPALLKVSCLPVLPTVQPSGSKQRPPINPVSARMPRPRWDRATRRSTPTAVSIRADLSPRPTHPTLQPPLAPAST